MYKFVEGYNYEVILVSYIRVYMDVQVCRGL